MLCYIQVKKKDRILKEFYFCNKSIISIKTNLHFEQFLRMVSQAFIYTYVEFDVIFKKLNEFQSCVLNKS